MEVKNTKTKLNSRALLLANFHCVPLTNYKLP